MKLENKSAATADAMGETNIHSGDIASLDLGEVYRNLRTRAQWSSRSMPDLFNSGVSAEDVVDEVLVEFLGSKNHLGWDPKKSAVADAVEPEAGLVRFLNAVLHRRMIDHIRRHNLRSPISIDDHQFVERAGSDRSVENVEFKELLDRLKTEAGGDKEIELFIEAALSIDQHSNINQQLAEITGKSTTEIVNTRKRLLRTLTAKGRRESWMRTIRSTRRSSDKGKR